MPTRAGSRCRRWTTTYADDAAQGPEQTEKQNLAIAVAGFGLASAGALVAPIFYLPSIAVCAYAFREIFTQPYRLFVEERRVDYRAVLAFSVAAAFDHLHEIKMTRLGIN